jgi:hypothetical protein
MLKRLRHLALALTLILGFSFSATPSFNQALAQSTDPCRQAFYVEEGQDIPTDWFETVQACEASIGACCIKSTNTTIYGLTPSECTGGGTNADRQAGACPAVAYSCYIKNTSGTCQPRSESECNTARANGTITYTSGATCSVGEAPGDSCYTKNSSTGECTLRTPAQCEVTENQGQETYNSEAVCKTAGMEPIEANGCYVKNANGSCTAKTAAECTTLKNSGQTTYGTAPSCAGAIAPVDNKTPTDTTGTGGTPNTPNQSTDANGTGTCAACLGLGGQAERDCYAQCSGTIATGICAGMTTTQCQQACAQAGGNPQVCTGTQEGAGTPRAGEFLSCSSSGSVNGCGQFDCLDPNNNNALIGFVIDTSQCTATGGTPTTNTPTTNTP